MGTRHLICVVLGGEYRIAQYGQWDGHPCGAGQEVVDFLKDVDFGEFRAKVEKTKAVARDEVERRWRNNGNAFSAEDRHLSRDTSAEILRYVLNADKPFVELDTEFAGDSLMCEWAYVLDLDTGFLEVFKGFNKEPLKPGDRFFDMPTRDKEFDDGHVKKYRYYQVKFVTKFLLPFVPEDAMAQVKKITADPEDDESAA